jgi:hypothetical protein
MVQRIFVSCRSNHDPIDIGHLACQTLLGRSYTYEKDYIRWAGQFGNKQNPTKCHVLIDCAVTEYNPDNEIPFLCYKVTSDGDRL